MARIREGRHLCDDQTKAMVDVAKGVAEILAYVLAGGFFVYRWISGYQTTNLSLEIIPTRQAHSDAEAFTDLLKIVVVLTKGDRGSAHIFNIGVIINGGQDVDLISGLEHYWVEKLDARRRAINWKSKDLKYVSFLNPGERTEVAVARDIAKGEIANIEVVVVGRRKWSHDLKQWRASAVSLPLQPLEPNPGCPTQEAT